MQHVLAEIILKVFEYFYLIFSLAHRTTQTPAASSPAAKTTSLGLVLISTRDNLPQYRTIFLEICTTLYNCFVDTQSPVLINRP